MNNSVCITGPAFSIVGDELLDSGDISFSIDFENEADVVDVRLYEWYIDDTIVNGALSRVLEGSIDCGEHKISCRLLTTDGWTGRKELTVSACGLPYEVKIVGDATIREGSSATFNIMGTYATGAYADITSHYNFSAAEGTFTGNRLSVPLNNIPGDIRDLTIYASGTGLPPADKLIKITDATQPAGYELRGEGSIKEGGASKHYSVFAVYGQGREADITSQYVFSCTEGTFSENVLTIPVNNIDNQPPRDATITARKKNQPTQSVQKQIEIVDEAIVVPQFDFMVLDFKWLPAGGRDLDIMVRFERTGTTADGVIAGYQGANTNSTTVPRYRPDPATAYLWWLDDSQTQGGIESVMIGLRPFIAENIITANIIEIGLYATWYGNVGTGDFEVSLITYLGGEMINQGTTLVNQGGQQLSAQTETLRMDSRNNNGKPEDSFRVGSVRFDRFKETASLYFNN